MQILDGKATAKQIQGELSAEVQALKDKGIHPSLTVILVGDDPASQVYVRNKERACQKVGIESRTIRLPKETQEAELLSLIEKLNRDPDVHGILVQLPLPEGISEEKVICTISPEKDVDGFHPVSMGRLLLGQDGFRSCTPYGIMGPSAAISYLLRPGSCGCREEQYCRQAHGSPPLAENATVTVCHSRTRNLER